MIQEILGAEHLDGSYWTLQVELFFYLQMLVWFMLGQLGRIRWIMGGWLVLAVVFGLAKKMDMHVSYTVGELLIVRYIPFFLERIKPIAEDHGATLGQLVIAWTIAHPVSLPPSSAPETRGRLLRTSRPPVLN